MQNGAGYTGQTFGGGFYVEYTASWNNVTPNSGKVAAVWGNAIEFLTNAATRWGELDLVEAVPIAAGDIAQLSFQVHDWSQSGSNIIDTNCNCGNSNQGNSPIFHNPLNVAHRYGTLWLPAAQNGGVGLVKRFFDDQEITTARQTYAAGSLPNPCPGNQACANGQFTSLDTSHFVLIIGADATIPVTVSSVSVWQLP